MDKQQTQYQLVTKWKWQMHSNFWKFPNRNVQTFGFVYHDRNGHHLWGGLLWERQFEKILFASRFGEGFQLGMLIRTPWKELFLSMHVDDTEISWKETKSWSDVETTQKRSRFGRTNIFPWSCLLGMYSKTVWNKSKILWTITEPCLSCEFLRWTEKLPYSEYFRISSWSPDMEGHAKKCVKRYCGLANRTTQQLYKESTMHPWSPFRKGRNEICRRIVTNMLSNCSIKFILGTCWKTWYSKVSVNELARSIRKWTKVCDKRLNRLISFIHNTCEYKQHLLCG